MKVSVQVIDKGMSLQERDWKSDWSLRPFDTRKIYQRSILKTSEAIKKIIWLQSLQDFYCYEQSEHCGSDSQLFLLTQ